MAERFVITQYVYASSRVPKELDGKKIAHISDLHGKMYGKNHSALLSAVAGQAPFAVFITGDLVDNEREDRNIGLSLLKGLYSDYGENVYFVPGNHERRCRKYNQIMDGIISTGISVPVGECVFRGKYAVLGIDSERLFDTRLKTAANRLAERRIFTLALAHRPDLIKRYAAMPIDLLFAGHAHGGQIRIGGRGIYAPNQGLLPKYTCGMYRYGFCTMLVSRGLGGKAPLRINNPHELVICTLRREK